MSLDNADFRVHHTGFLARDIEVSAAALEDLGYTRLTGVIRDDEPSASGARRNVDLCFLESGGTVVELVSPIDETSDVYNTLRANGEGPYHICYAVASLEDAIASLREKRWRVLRRPSPAVAFSGSPVAFLVKKGAGMIELVQAPVKLAQSASAAAVEETSPSGAG